MVKSMSVRKVNQFNLPEDTINILINGVPLGTITKTTQTLSIDDFIFQKYKCTYAKVVHDDIVIFDSENGEPQEYTQYHKAFDFNIFYSEKEKLLFSEATTPITKVFLKKLKGQKDVDFDYELPNFDLQGISNLMQQTRGVRFNSEDNGVHSKSFNGDEVDVNDEVIEALQNSDATSLMGEIDVLNLSRTLMLTQSGSLVIFTPLNDLGAKEFPMLEFSLAALRRVGWLNKNTN